VLYCYSYCSLVGQDDEKSSFGYDWKEWLQVETLPSSATDCRRFQVSTSFCHPQQQQKQPQPAPAPDIVTALSKQIRSSLLEWRRSIFQFFSTRQYYPPNEICPQEATRNKFDRFGDDLLHPSTVADTNWPAFTQHLLDLQDKNFNFDPPDSSDT